MHHRRFKDRAPWAPQLAHFLASSWYLTGRMTFKTPSATY